MVPNSELIVVEDDARPQRGRLRNQGPEQQYGGAERNTETRKAFATFHGHAHGAEMPQTLSGIGYGVGFVLATGALHLLGIAVGLISSSSGGSFARRTMQLAGLAIAGAGGGLLAGLV